MWSTLLTVNNETDYRVVINKRNLGKLAVVKPNASWSSNVTNIENEYQLVFNDDQGNIIMTGFCIFGKSKGVSVDRGWIYTGPQIIKLTAQANDKTFIQKQNGGRQVLNYNEFENGGNITLTYEKQL